MRGLIKRDDPKLQASVHTPGSAGQLPDSACLRSCAVAGGAAAAHAHVRNELIPRRLLSCGASSDAEAFIRWRHAALTPSSAAATRILGRPCLHPPHTSPGLSSGCLSTRQTSREEWGARYAFFPPNVFSSLYVRTRSLQDAASDSLVELSYDLPKIASLLAAHSRSDLAQHVAFFRRSSRVSGK